MRTMPRALLLLLLSTVCLFASATAQDRVLVDAKFVPASAAPGTEVVLELQLEIEAGWHVYGKKDPNEPLKLVVPDTLGLVPKGAHEFPDGEKHEAFGDINYWVSGKPVLRQRYTVPKDAKPGERKLAGTIDYLVCNENSCDPPAQTPFSAKLAIVPSGDAAAPAKTDAPKTQNPLAGAVDTKSDTKPASGAQPGLQLLGGGNKAEDKVKVSARVEPKVARAGETVRLIVKVEVVDDWHVYGSQETTGLPVRLEVADGEDLPGVKLAGRPVLPPGEPHGEGAFLQYWLTGSFEITQDLAVAADAAVGERKVTGITTYSVCDENTCLDPAEVPFATAFTVEAGAARGAQTTSQKPVPAPAGGPAAKPPAPAPESSSLWVLLLSCIGGGLFALAMPCTYPMIPITFSFFTKQAEQRGGKVLSLALVYGIGIVLMFVLVGVLLSSLIVDIVGHWATNAVIFVSFVLFAAVLFGWVNLQPPQALQRAAGNAGRLGGYLGVFFMGATLVLTSFTCTAPIVGTLLANVAQEGPMRVALGMAVFGLTMALPFVVLALVPTKVKQMPRSGEWMETLKISLGFVELAASFKFLSQVDIAFGWQLLPRELFLLLWTAIFLLWALFLFGILRKAGTVNEGVGNGRMAAGMLVSLLAAYFAFGALGYRLDFVMTNFVPAYSGTQVVERAGGKQGAGGHTTAHVLVKDDAATAVALAKREGKLLLYNFTGFN